VEIIRSFLDFDISWSESSKLFICKAVLQAAVEISTSKWKGLRAEKGNCWIFPTEDKNQLFAYCRRWEQSRAAGIQNLPVPSMIRAKVSKSLQFSTAEDVWVTFGNNQAQVTNLTPPTNVGFSPRQRINPHEFRPQFSSTPISSSAPVNYQVKVSI